MVAAPRTGVVGANIHSEPAVSMKIRILSCFSRPTHVVTELLAHTADCCCLAVRRPATGRAGHSWRVVSAWERSTAATRRLGLADVLDQAKAREVLALFVIQPRDAGAVTDAAANLLVVMVTRSRKLRESIRVRAGWGLSAAKYAAPHAIW